MITNAVPWKIFGTVCAFAIAVIIIVIIVYHSALFPQLEDELDPPDVTEPLPPSDSILRNFSRAAVVTNGAPCADIAIDILKQGGNAVDAMIGAMLCDEIGRPQSSGIGGGFFMVIYNRKQKKTYTINARETAPFAAKPDMYKDNPEFSKLGPLAIAVPGQMNGLWTAYKKFGGGIPWRNIVYPSIKLCEEGVTIDKYVVSALEASHQDVQKYKILKKLFTNSTTGKFVKVGDIYKNLQLGKTLRVIAEEGGQALYTGSLAPLLVSDIQNSGGIITREDLSNYTCLIEEPIKATIFEKYTLHTVSPPSSGIILNFILNTLKDLVPAPTDSLNTQRITEAFKYAYGIRTQLGDPHFTNISKLIDFIASDLNLNKVSKLISDTRTWNNVNHYGGSSSVQVDHGTASLSIIAENGDAVSVTSTINFYFGSKVVSPSTGIILNNQMDDFSIPYAIIQNLLPSNANSIVPGKRPVSSVCPSIITDSNGDVTLAIGGSGGTRITTAVSLVILNLLALDKNIKEAIDSPRFHHQLLPMVWFYEYGTLKTIINHMQKIGHSIKRSPHIACVNAIDRRNNLLFANADYRRRGSIAGF